MYVHISNHLPKSVKEYKSLTAIKQMYRTFVNSHIPPIGVHKLPARMFHYPTYTKLIYFAKIRDTTHGKA